MANKKKNNNDQKDLKENPFSKEGLENINKINFKSFMVPFLVKIKRK